MSTEVLASAKKKSLRFRSLRFRLIVAGIAAALIPLSIVGSVAVNKSGEALTALSKRQAENVAKDFALLTRTHLEAEFVKIKILAAKKLVIDAVTAKNRGEDHDLTDINSNLQKTVETIGKNYEGIFVTDSKGNSFAGSLEGGKEGSIYYSGVDVSDKDYFKKAISSGDASIGAAAWSKSGKEIAVVLAAPVRSQSGTVEGTCCIAIKIGYFTKLISERKIGKTGYAYMISKTDGMVIEHPVKEIILKTNIYENKEMEKFSKALFSGNTGVEQYIYKGVNKVAGYAPVGINEWYIATTQDKDEFLALADSIRNISILIGAIAVAATLIAFLIISTIILKPVKSAVAGLKDIASGDGDLTMRLEVKSSDEIGELALWFNTFMEKLQYIIRQIASSSKNVNDASSDLSSIAVKLSTNADDTASRSDNVAASAEEMSTNINNVAAAMEESSTNTDMVASAAEEMNATIQEIAKSSEKARDISVDAVEKSKSAFNRMSELEKGALAISKITETIRDISDQTKLLSLNATIEAARAGEAGKGFAVVANEIKELSNQTAQATLNIKNQIDGIQQMTDISIKEIDQISNVINDVSDIVSTIAAAVEEQSSATMEISSNINQVSTGIRDVNENINQSSSVAHEITKDITKVNSAASEISRGSSLVRSSAENLSSMAKELSQIVGKFKI